jgi:hypothetical protein
MKFIWERIWFFRKKKRSPMIQADFADFCDSCDFNIYKGRADSLMYASCSSGGTSCFYAYVVEPMNVSNMAFSSLQLKGATTAINAILKTVRLNSPDGAELCFLRVPGGVMLAWVQRDGPVEGEAITSRSDPDMIRERLGLTTPDESKYK